MLLTVNNLFSISFVGIFLCGCVNANQSGMGTDLDGYEIVTPDKSIPAEQTAAEELQYYLREMTGVTVPIVGSAECDGGKMIAVGFNSKLPTELSQGYFEQIGGEFKLEEILIASNGETLILSGGRPRGAIYAVYEYLHRLGVRWYSPEYTNIPTLKHIEFKEELYRYNPPIFSRTQASGNMPTQEWSARNRLNSHVLWLALEEKYGGGLGQGPDMHTLANRLVRKPILENFPEWLAMVDGKREKPVTHTWGVCLSNKDLRNYIIERTLQWARKNPDRQCVWFGQNDGSNYCQCEKCKAFYDAHGGEPSSLCLQMTNELAERIALEFPDKIVKTLAYSWSMTPPKNMKVRDNVIITFCAWGGYDSTLRHDQTEKGARIRKAMDGWREIGNRFEVYLYSPTVYWEVRPALLPACDNIKWAFDNGINNIYIQISGFGGLKGSDMVDLKSWIYARLCWDPSLDPKMLVKDFCDGFYGPEGKTVYDAIIAMHSGVLDENNVPLKLNDCSNIPQSIDLKKLRKTNIDFQKAYDRIEDPVYKKHFSYAWISFLWTDFWAGYEDSGKFYDDTSTWKVPMQDGELRNHYAKLIKSFMLSNGVTGVGELKPLNPGLLSIDLMGIPLEAHKLKNDAISAVVVPEIAGRIEDFVDNETGFKPFKPYWGFLMSQYPLYGSTRDYVNGGFVKEYRFVKQSDKMAVMEGNAGKHHVTKTVELNGNRMEVELQVKPGTSETLAISRAVMLDLQDDGFGNYPTVHVEKKDGQWIEFITLGAMSDFWYQYGPIDISETTGRVVITSGENKHGLLLEFDPARINKMSYEYDRWDTYSNKAGRMVWITPTSEQDGTSGEIKSVKVAWTILADYDLLLK